METSTRLHRFTSQETVLFIVTTVRISSLLHIVLTYNINYEYYGRPGFESRQRQEIIPQPPIEWVPWNKRPGRDANYSSPSSAEVKNGGAIALLPIRLHGVVLN
jgi:hypothetical protein